VRQTDPATYHELDMEFHLGFAKLYGNVEILRALEGLKDRMLLPRISAAQRDP
jgi:DNA-binding GntR family transcriptional regulator